MSGLPLASGPPRVIAVGPRSAISGPRSDQTDEQRTLGSYPDGVRVAFRTNVTLRENGDHDARFDSGFGNYPWSDFGLPSHARGSSAWLAEGSPSSWLPPPVRSGHQRLAPAR